ncbi:endonuclease/exonuclease/phosphatase family protein [Planctomicrobium sp. SH661]|uniref:endonuclease/exonuclease/phosphatase family protein n=1 Tax=Planctomicrobium sp. SH661 TaxID=3448124 RepID=UPI003F5C008A
MPKTVFRSLLVTMLVLHLTRSELLAAEPVETLKVMSFNIRFGSARDGENSWKHRKQLVVETIRKFDPDLLGTQETEMFQKDDLASELAGYTPFAAGRTDGKQQGETMAVFYRTERFTKLDGGHFWLSETPEVPGSKSWDSSLPRMATWLKLQDNRHPEKPVVWFFNTHFDHRGEVSRAEAARLLHDRVAALEMNSAVVITGDFNTGEGSTPYKTLFAQHDGRTLLMDAYRVAHPDRTSIEGTYNGFKPENSSGERIDWIGMTAPLQVESISINRVTQEGRLPSDHFPLEAIFRYSR